MYKLPHTPTHTHNPTHYSLSVSLSLTHTHTHTHTVLAQARIKWPNDIYTADGSTKLGGVLCQSSVSDGQFEVVTGVGVNVFNTAPTTCLNALAAAADLDRRKKGEGFGEGEGGTEGVLSAAAEEGEREGRGGGEGGEEGKKAGRASASPVVTREALLSSFLSIFEGMMDEFRVKGFRPFTAEYTDAWLHTGQRVMVQQQPPSKKVGAAGGVRGGTQEGTAEPVRVPMIVRGISASTAALLAEDERGRRCELYPDGNRFDFFNGLISQRT